MQENKILFLDFKSKTSAENTKKMMAYVGIGTFLLSTLYCVMTKQKVGKSILIVAASNIASTSATLGVSYLIKK